MASSKRNNFQWRCASVILLLLIGIIITYDTQKHGSFEGKNSIAMTTNEFSCSLISYYSIVQLIEIFVTIMNILIYLRIYLRINISI